MNKVNNLSVTNDSLSTIDWCEFYRTTMGLEELSAMLIYQKGKQLPETKEAIRCLNQAINDRCELTDLAVDAGYFTYPERDENDRHIDCSYNTVLRQEKQGKGVE